MESEPPTVRDIVDQLFAQHDIELHAIFTRMLEAAHLETNTETC